MEAILKFFNEAPPERLALGVAMLFIFALLKIIGGMRRREAARDSRADQITENIWQLLRLLVLRGLDNDSFKIMEAAAKEVAKLPSAQKNV